MTELAVMTGFILGIAIYPFIKKILWRVKWMRYKKSLQTH